MVLQLLILIICGVITAAIASHKGRNIVGWFFAGFFIGIIGIIIICCMSNLKTETVQRRQAQLERHRLREQLRQERLKTEAFRRYSMGRLDAHDEAIGLDTRQPNMLPGAPGAPAALPGVATGGIVPVGQPLPAGTAVPPTAPPVARWYYELSGQSMGPVTDDEVSNLIALGTIVGSTLLWAEGLSDWTATRNIPAFSNEVPG